MVFEVRRTKGNIEKPFKDCFPLNLTRVERYLNSTPEEYNKACAHITGKKWNEVGTNHRIINNILTRDVGERQTWGIRIDSLKELMAFKNEVNEELILTVSTIDGITPCIEIYDDLKR